MTEVQLFPKVHRHEVHRNKLSDDELSAALSEASPHVRYLLKELTQTDEIPASKLKSKRVSYAIVQRICNSAGKDSLVGTREDDATGEKIYRVNDEYRDAVKPMVAAAQVPPPARCWE